MSKETYCGKEAHVHTEACYRSQTPLCGKEEGEPNEGHVHDETCYEEVRNLICGLEESETHAHADECYETTTTQTCGKEESEPTEGHTHSDECYKSEEFQCGKEEHEHTRICESNKEDVEDPADWEKAYQDINNEEDAKTRILTVAKNELGTKENKNNFEIDEEEKEHYYTRYGHLYEDKYGDWNNYFTGYVLKYANVQMSYDKDASKWQNKTIHDQKEEGEEGNVVFFRNDEGELRTGIVTSIDDLKKEIRVIEGDVEGEVKEERVNKDKVIAYLNDQIEIIEDDTPLAGEGMDIEEVDANEKSVDVDGKDQTVQVGDQITLTAQTEGFEEEQVLSYQWQYNASEDCAEDAWENLEGETNQQLVLDVTEENIDYFWRVYVEPQPIPSTGGVDPNAMPKLSLNLRFEGEVIEGESPENDSTNTIVYGVPFVLNDNISLAANSSVSSTDKVLEIQKGWSNENVDHPNEIKVTIKKNGSDVETVTLSAENNWRAVYKISRWDEIDDYSVEEEKIKNWNPIYTSVNITSRLQQYTYGGGISNPFIITDSDMNYALIRDGGQLKSLYIGDLADPYNLANYPQEALWYRNQSGNIYQSVREMGTTDSYNNYQPRFTYYTIQRNVQSLRLNKSNSVNGDSFSIDNNRGFYVSGWSDKYYISVNANGVITSTGKASNKVWVASERTGKKIIITNSPQYGGNQITGDDTMINGFPIAKTIDYLGDQITIDSGYKDLQKNKYRLSLSAGPIAGEVAESPVNVLFVLDTSGSMVKDSNNKPNEEKYTDAKNAIINTSSSIMGLNGNNLTSVIRFSDNASVLKEWDSNQITSGIFGSATGGTNYQAALNLAQVQLNKIPEDRRKNPTFVIFLSDGQPSFTNSGGGGQTLGDDTAKLVTQHAIQSFKQSNPNVIISTIGYETNDANDYLSMLATNGRFYQSTSSNIVDEMTSILVGPKITSGVIVDTLSDWVAFDEKTNVKIIARSKGTDAKEYVLYDETQPNKYDRLPNSKEQGKYYEKAEIFDSVEKPYSINNNVITATFKTGWQMDPAYEFVLSFNVKVKKEAYEEYQKKGYSDVGDENTDTLAYQSQLTSSNKEGFYSNVSGENNSVFKFTYVKSDNSSTNQQREYLKPVVQIHKDYLLNKIDKTNNKPLANIEFSLYRKNDNASVIPKTNVHGEAVEGANNLKTDEEGKVSIPVHLEPGTYYLIETTTPSGYLVPSDVWTLVIEEKGNLTVEGNGIYITKENNEEVKTTEGKIIESPDLKLQFSFTVENEPGQSLPNTGGTGTQLFTFSGGAIIAASSLMYGYKKRSKRNKTGKGGK